ncbi:MAG: serpin family protein [Tissierellia bacterium]|nr:serpin family protein [Tissierellia bacterium]
MYKKIFVVLMGLLLASCSPSTVSEDDVENEESSFKNEELEIADDVKIRRDYVEFIQSLDDGIKNSMEDEENFAYSTLGLSIPLSVATNFAKGDDRAVIFQSLGIDPSMDLAKEAGILQYRSQGDEGEKAIEYNNSLWINQSKPIIPEELKKDALKFQGEVYALNFDETADEKYQEWQEEVFGETLSSRQFSDDDALFLANGLEFNASFFNPFEQDDTREGEFFNDNGSTSTVDMMHQKISAAYENVDNYERIILPMDQGFFTTIILPKEGKFDEVLDNLKDIRRKDLPEYQTVQLALPRMEMKQSVELGDSLKEGPLAPLFEFYDNHISKEQIKITDIGQSSLMELHEQGISVKALSEISIDTKSMIPETDLSMIVNRPFILMVEKDVDTDHKGMNLPVYTMGIRDMTTLVND